MMNNKAQVTAFLIVGIILIVMISLLFLLNKNDVSTRGEDFNDPESYLSLCLKERASPIIEQMLLGGGFLKNNDTILYRDQQITYLCKTVNNFEPCVNQYPLYLTRVEREFERQIENDAEVCFESLKETFTNRGYEFEAGPLTIESTFKPSIVEITLKSEVFLKKGELSRTFSRFDTFVPTKIYDIAFVTNEILAQEAKWCYFSTDGFMTLYPEFFIASFLLDDTTNIYTIKNKETQETLMMATRGCVIPAGYF